MSIKIYDAARWDTTDVFAVAHQIRDNTIAARVNTSAERAAVALIDAAHTAHTSGNTYNARAALAEHRANVAAHAISAHRHQDDLSVTATIMASPADPDHLYSIVYAANPELAAAAHQGADDHSWWNHTDTRPEGVTETAWTQRINDWRDILGEHLQHTPADVGVTVTVDHNTRGADWQDHGNTGRELLRAAIETELRQRRHAATQPLDGLIRRLVEDLGGDPDADRSIPDTITVDHVIGDYASEPQRS